MPFALILIGIVLLIAAIQGTEKDLGSALYADFTGSGSYLIWAIAIVAIGAVGYIQPLKRFSDAFLALILITLLVSEQGFFAQFTSALSQAVSSPQTLPADSQASPLSSTSTSSSNNGIASGIAAGAPLISSLL